MSREFESISINQEILRNGYHITIVTQGVCPRFLYTIGLKERFGFDLIVPGCAKFYPEDLLSIIRRFANLTSKEMSLEITVHESFRLVLSNPSWVELMALGAIDYYGEITSFMQIFPDDSNFTIDTPNLSKAWDATAEPVWQWLKEPWPFPVSSISTATTNLAALRGERITEAARWAEDGWELFAGSGPETPEEDIRVMPLATLLGHDPSMFEVVRLGIGKAAWRDANQLLWHDWAAKR